MTNPQLPTGEESSAQQDWLKQEQQLQDALNYADNIIATLREPFVVLDSSLRVKTASRAFYQNFQVAPDETQGRFLYDLGNGQWNIPELRTLLDEVLVSSRAVHDFGVEHDFPTIGKRFMRLNARRFESVENQPDMVLLAIEDVTERQSAKRLVSEAEQGFRGLLDTLPAAAYTCDAAGLITYFNQSAAELWGREPKLNDPSERFCGSFKLFMADGIPVAHEECWMALTLRNSKAYNEFEGVIERADGSRRTALAHVNPFYDVAGQLVGAVSVLVDITDRKRAEASVADSESQYRRLFETARDGILILDASSLKIIDANPYMTELLGYTHGEFLGRELWEIGFFGDKESSQAIYQELQEQGYIRYDHLPLETKRGDKAEVEFVSNIYQVDQRLVAQCNIRDITERSPLERKTLEQATALADLHRRKDEFLAMLSHELRNPLAPIMNAVQLLGLQQNEDQLQYEARTIIERQVGQLTRLVDDLLEVSRITTGRIHLNQERLALNLIVEHAVETVGGLIGQRQHTLELSLPAEPIWVYGDSARLEQVVVNLLNNAAKYTDERGRIWLSVLQEGDEAVLRVRDTGVGISPMLLPRIFELFAQAERSLDRSQGGLGIGLCLVQQLVEMHRGQVEAVSVLGQGSEFVVRLPVFQSTPALSVPVPPVAQPKGNSLRVLVVDDNVDAASTLAMLLKASGHEVRKAHDGPPALEIALDYRPQVVLLDIGLPSMNGFEVAKRLREQPDLANVVLIAMTGYGQDSDRERSREAGFDHHLVKPANFSQVREILAAITAK